MRLLRSENACYVFGFNPLKNQNQNQRYEGSLWAFTAPYQGDFKKECVSPVSLRFVMIPLYYNPSCHFFIYIAPLRGAVL